MKISVRRTDSEGRGENNNASEQEERDREPDNLDAIGRWFDHFLATLLKDLDLNYIVITRILKKYSRFFIESEEMKLSPFHENLSLSFFFRLRVSDSSPYTNLLRTTVFAHYENIIDLVTSLGRPGIFIN